MPMDILLYAGVTFVLLVALFRTIGTKHGQERERPNPFAGAGSASDPLEGTAQQVPELRAAISADMPRGVDAALVQIAIADHGFDARRFVQQAKDAFIIIVSAFAKGDRATLKDMLSDKVYAHFDAEIQARENANETLMTEVQAIRGADIVAADMVGNVASVSVRFNVLEIYAVRTAEGATRVGNATRPVELIDVWTFTRDTKGNDPRWFLTATRPDESAASERAG